ncbi:MAG TPA: hypothetical protein VHF67_08855 [Gaiellaceae bacterium]|nr:hypothetical protein [Gaiellaceae bacterium]
MTASIPREVEELPRQVDLPRDRSTGAVAELVVGSVSWTAAFSDD